MPLMLNDLAQSTTVKTYSPKFFCKELTGNGSKLGLLQETRDPKNVGKGVKTPADAIDPKRGTFKSGDTTVNLIPLFVIPAALRAKLQTVDAEPLDEWTKFAEEPSHNVHAYVRMSMHAVTLSVKTFPTDPATGTRHSPQRDVIAVWRIDVLVHDTTLVPGNASGVQRLWTYIPTPQHLHDLPRSPWGGGVWQHGTEGVYTEFYSVNPRAVMKNVNAAFEHEGYAVDQQATDDLIESLNLYDAICKRSEIWQTSIDQEVKLGLDIIHWGMSGNASSTDMRYYATDMLRRLEAYNVPLDIYKRIYADIKATFSPDEADEMCKDNLNLLLSNTMFALDAAKPSLEHLTVPTPPPVIKGRFSKEQVNALSSEAPLTLVQSGAGTGKSTVILGRIAFMIACGVNPADITVLSFTNAAADHISECNPYVHSMTIAKMVHSIYEMNYPGHDLSTNDTLMNSIDIFLPNDAFATTFKDMLYRLTENASSSFTQLNLFVEHYFDEVMKVLDACHQTTLDLEIVICYQKIDQLSEPPEVASKHLIIDEVQDNSIFEFVYTLKYVNKHRESMFIVGDCSQTLFEFRASNPRALNVMEGSGVFTPYKLQTNYRSNQAILDFANLNSLAEIEANQYANIRLQANDLTPITSKAFAEKVHVDYHRVRNKAEFEVILPNLFRGDLKTYIDACVARREQVTFLAFTNKCVRQMQGILTQVYPGATVVNIAPDKVYTSNILSSFIRRYWDEVKFMPTSSPIVTVQTEILNHLDRLTKNPAKARPSVSAMLCEWADESRDIVTAWEQQFLAGYITRQEFLNLFRKQMVDYEIRRNAVKQSIASNKNNERKHSDEMRTANFLLSTIHSAKGLEFQNVVIIYDASKDSDEEFKRLYYVACTRAMNTEYIIAYDTRVDAPVHANYQLMLKTLQDEEAAAAAAAATPDMDVVVVTEESRGDEVDVVTETDDEE